MTSFPYYSSPYRGPYPPPAPQPAPYHQPPTTPGMQLAPPVTTSVYSPVPPKTSIVPIAPPAGMGIEQVAATATQTGKRKRAATPSSSGTTSSEVDKILLRWSKIKEYSEQISRYAQQGKQGLITAEEMHRVVKLNAKLNREMNTLMYLASSSPLFSAALSNLFSLSPLSQSSTSSSESGEEADLAYPIERTKRSKKSTDEDHEQKEDRPAASSTARHVPQPPSSGEMYSGYYPYPYGHPPMQPTTSHVPVSYYYPPPPAMHFDPYHIHPHAPFLAQSPPTQPPAMLHQPVPTCSALPNPYMPSTPNTQSPIARTSAPSAMASTTSYHNISVPMPLYSRQPANLSGGKCRMCGTQDTPMWRRGPDGPKTLCNACGLKYAKQVKTSSATTISSSTESTHGNTALQISSESNPANRMSPRSPLRTPSGGLPEISTVATGPAPIQRLLDDTAEPQSHTGYLIDNTGGGSGTIAKVSGTMTGSTVASRNGHASLRETLTFSSQESETSG